MPKLTVLLLLFLLACSIAFMQSNASIVSFVTALPQDDFSTPQQLLTSLRNSAPIKSFHALQTTIPFLNVNITTDFDASVAFNPKTTYPNDPTNYNEWLGYLFFLIITFICIFIGCTLLVCLCCCFCCGRCCQLCGGMRPTKSFKQGYKDPPRIIIVIPYAIVCVAITLVTLVGIAFTIVFAVSIGNVVNSAYDFSNNSMNLLQTIPQNAVGIRDSVSNVITAVNNSVIQLFDISQPISMFRNLQSDSLAKVNGLYFQLVHIQTNYSQIAEKMNAIYSRPEMTSQQNPLQNFNPNIDPQQVLTFAQNASTQVDNLINQMQGIAGGLPDTVSQGFAQFAPQITNTLNDGITLINDSLNVASQYVNMYVPESTRNYAKAGVLSAEAVRAAVISVIMASGLIVVTAGLLFMACSFKWKCCWGIWLTSAIILILPIAYFVVFSFQVMTFVVVRDACQQGPGAADRVQAKLLTEENKRTIVDTIRQKVPADVSSRINWQPLYNVSFTETARKLYYCDEDQTVFDAAGLHLNQIANISSLLELATSQIDQYMNQINVTTVLEQMKQPIQNWDFTSVIPQFNYEANITQFLGQIGTVKAQLSDPAFFGYNATKANETVSEFNNFLSSRGIFVIYTLENITTVNSTDPQFSSLTAQEKQQVDNVGNEARALRKSYDDALVVIADMIANVTVIENSLYNILGSLNGTNYFLNQILQIPQEAIALIDSLQPIIEGKKNQISGIVDTVGDGINDLLGQVEGVTKCNFAGDFLRDSVTSVCVPMNLSTVVLSGANALIGILMLLIFPISLIAAKRFTWKWKPIEESTTVVSTAVVSPVSSGGLIEETTVVHEIHDIPMHNAMLHQGNVRFGDQEMYSHLTETPNSPQQGDPNV